MHISVLKLQTAALYNTPCTKVYKDIAMSAPAIKLRIILAYSTGAMLGCSGALLLQVVEPKSKVEELGSGPI